MSTVTKKELVDRIAQSTQTRRVLVESVIQHFLDEIGIAEKTQGIKHNL